MSGHDNLARTWGRYGERKSPRTSNLYRHIATRISASPEALRAIATLPYRKRNPQLVLAALHYLVLSGEGYSAFTESDPDEAARAAIDMLTGKTNALLDIVSQRHLFAGESRCFGVLYPAIAEAVNLTGATAVGLIDAGSEAGLNLNVDRIGITHSTGQRAGDPESPVQVACSLVGNNPVPEQTIAEVVSRIVTGTTLLDVTRSEDIRWMLASIPPDQPERAARLAAEINLAATNPPALMQGDAIDLLPDAIAAVPEDALPVVLTTWMLSGVRPERRDRLPELLQTTARKRKVAWLSIEGVGVAPGIPTLGDRPASGHSIVGLTLFKGTTRHVEAIGRCWLRGEMLEWRPEEGASAG